MNGTKKSTGTLFSMVFTIAVDLPDGCRDNPRR